MTIEERAKQLAVIDDDGFCVYDPNIYEACIKIAEEQRKKACYAFCEFCPHQCTGYPHDDCLVLIEYKQELEK